MNAGLPQAVMSSGVRRPRGVVLVALRFVALRFVALGFVTLGLTAVVTACSSLKNAGIHARMTWSEQQGLTVIDVPPGPASAAGLRPGDRIISIDGKPVRSLSLKQAVTDLRGSAGTKVKLEVVRDQRILSLKVERIRYDR